MELEFVNDQRCLVVLLVVEILLCQLLVEVIVDSGCQLHFIDEIKQHLCANTFNLGECDILVLLVILYLLLCDLIKQVVEQNAANDPRYCFIETARLHQIKHKVNQEVVFIVLQVLSEYALYQRCFRIINSLSSNLKTALQQCWQILRKILARISEDILFTVGLCFKVYVQCTINSAASICVLIDSTIMELFKGNFTFGDKLLVVVLVSVILLEILRQVMHRFNHLCN